MTSQRRRAYGQHFLTNPSITDKIVRLAEVTKGDTVLEIGPGRGILTDSLLKTGCRVIAVEKDRELAEVLQSRYADNDAIAIYTTDFLKFDIPKNLCGAGIKVVANLPYSIATEIIFRLIDHRELFSTLTLMVQKEVAERLVASPGSKAYGVLAILTQLFSESAIVMKLAPGAFSPPPKVDSAVVRMRLSNTPRVAMSNVAQFKALVKQAFATRRKMLRNALGIKDDQQWQGICSELGISSKARAEELSLEQFAQLTQALP